MVFFIKFNSIAILTWNSSMEKVAIKCKLFAIKQQRAVKNSDITQFLCGTIKIRRVENSINFHEFFSLGGDINERNQGRNISKFSLLWGILVEILAIKIWKGNLLLRLTEHDSLCLHKKKLSFVSVFAVSCSTKKNLSRECRMWTYSGMKMCSCERVEINNVNHEWLISGFSADCTRFTVFGCSERQTGNFFTLYFYGRGI